MEYANVPRRVANLIALPEGGVDHALWSKLHDEYTLEDLYNLIEINTVAQSWRAARIANAKAVRDDG